MFICKRIVSWVRRRSCKRTSGRPVAFHTVAVLETVDATLIIDHAHRHTGEIEFDGRVVRCPTASASLLWKVEKYHDRQAEHFGL